MLTCAGGWRVLQEKGPGCWGSQGLEKIGWGGIYGNIEKLAILFKAKAQTHFESAAYG